MKPLPEGLTFISAQPHDPYFQWQIEVQIVNFRKHGISDRMHVLVWVPKTGRMPGWEQLEKKYPEVKFFYYLDFGVDLKTYIPQLRPHILKQHFSDFPDLKNKPVFYHDSDIIFNYLPDFGVEEDCLKIRKFLMRDVNLKYFRSENEGFQSWCADMWAVNFNLWKRGIETKVTEALDFSWATDHIDSFHRKPIYHNAGATSGSKNIFYKGAWISKSPIGQKLSVSQNFASAEYVKAIEQVTP
jgi:hypothetical protein